MADGRLHVLGPVQLYLGHELTPLGGERRRALLGYLGLHAERTVTAAQVIDGVWGSAAPTTVGKSLTTLLSRLRATLLPAGISIDHTGTGYRLSAGSALDITRFRDGVVAARVAELDTEQADAVSHLQEALAQWRGEAFLDVGDPPFAAPARQALEEERRSAQDTLVRLLLVLGETAPAVAQLQVQVQDTPYREDRWAVLVRALADAGRRAEALEAYQQARILLDNDLGLVPGEALRSAERHALAVRVRQVAVAPEGAEGGAPLGRAAVVSRVDEALRTVVAEGGLRVVLLTGEPGVGKTHLLQAISDRVRARGGEALGGRCDPAGALPLAPALAALDQARDRDLLGPTSLTDAPILAEALGAAGPQIADGPFELRRRQLLREVDAVVRQLARDRPVVLTVDDLQWVDPLTAAALEQLAAGGADLPVLLLLAARGPAALTGAAGDLVAELRRAVPFDLVRLDPLPGDDLRRVLAVAVGPAATVGDTFDEVRRGSGGNPLYAIHLARHLVSAPDAATPDGDLLELCAHRVGALPEPVREVLVAAAVLGDGFRATDLAAMLGAPPATVLARLEDATSAGLLEPGATPDRTRFVHGLVHKAIYDGIDPGRRAALHRTAAAVLRDRVGVSAVEGVEHLLRAGSLVPVDELGEALLAAGRGALQLGAVEHARRLLEQGLDADASPELAVELRTSLAEALIAARDTDPAHAHLEAAIELATALERWELVADAVFTRIGLGPVPTVPQARNEAAHIASLLERDLDPRRRANLLWAHGHLLVNVEPEDAGASIDEAEQLTARIQAPMLQRLVEALRLRQDEAADGDPVRAIDRAQVLLNRSLASQDTVTAALAGAAIQAARVRAGAFKACLAGAEDLEAVARSSGRLAIELQVAAASVAALMATATVAKADKASAELATRAEAAGAVTASQVLRFLNLVGIRREQGRLHELAPVLAFTAPAVERPGLGVWVAAAHLEQGEVDEAHEVFESLPELALAARQDWTRLSVLCEVADVAYDLGVEDDAEALYEALAPYAGRVGTLSGIAFLSGRVDRFLGRLAHLQGDLDTAVVHLAAARELDHAAGCGLWAGWAAHDEARARRARGSARDDREIERLLGQASMAARRLGSRRLARAAAATRAL